MGTSKKTCQSASDVQFANFLVIRIQIQRDKKIQKNRLVWFNIPLTYYAYDGPVNCGYFLILFQCDLYHLHSRVLKGCSSDLVPNTIPYWKVPVSRCFNFSPKCSQFRLSNYIIKTKFGFNLECWSIRNIICCCNSYSIQNVYVNISITKKQAVFNACIL